MYVYQGMFSVLSGELSIFNLELLSKKEDCGITFIVKLEDVSL